MVADDDYRLTHAPMSTNDVDLGVTSEMFGSAPFFGTSLSVVAFFDDVGCDKPNWFDFRFILGRVQAWNLRSR